MDGQGKDISVDKTARHIFQAFHSSLVFHCYIVYLYI